MGFVSFGALFRSSYGCLVAEVVDHGWSLGAGAGQADTERRRFGEVKEGMHGAWNDAILFTNGEKSPGRGADRL